MLKSIAFGIALLATMWSVPALCQTEHQDGAVVRTMWGIRFDVPAGWEWTQFDGTFVNIQHIATKSGPKVEGKERSTNHLTVDSGDFDGEWDRLDRNERRSFPNGATARWRLGAPDRFLYVFQGEITIGSRKLIVELLDQPTPRFDASLVETAFLEIAAALRSVPESAVIYHPDLRYAVDKPNDSWDTRFGGYVRFECRTEPEPNGCGEGSHTVIYAHPSNKADEDIRVALASITSNYAKKYNLEIGAVRHADTEGGEVVWTEQPDTGDPFLGVVRRNGRNYLVYMIAGRINRTNDALRPDFLAVAKSVRPWDGK